MNYRQVHLDFHTSEKISPIGEKFDKKQFQKALTVGHVNSITIFAKCHHGYLYYNSRIGERHPGLNFDLLGTQIEAAHEIGVKTPVYISVGYDEKAVREHPQWRYEDITHEFDNFSIPRYHLLCLNTPYLDYLLEQIKEVVMSYDADGIFLDIVGVRKCCCGSCMKAMLERGMNPNNSEDVNAFGEDVYANYLKRVREVVDSIKPGLPIFHNGGHIRQGRRDLAYANSHLELESLPTGGWGYDHFPVSARYAQNLGLEFLGMTGKFHKSWGEFGGYKHPNALKYEVALSAAHGAKCSIGDQLAPDGHMDMTTYKLIGEAYEELQQKEEWLERVKPVCDIGVLTLEACLNDAGGESKGNSLTKSDTGAGRILLEGKYMFSMIDKDVDFNQFKIIILPDEIELSDEVLVKLKAFIAKGGKLLASGSSAIRDDNFLFDFGAEYVGEGEYNPSYIRPVTDNENLTDYIMYSAYKKIKLNGGKKLAEVVPPYFNRTAEHFCSHVQTPSSRVPEGAGIVAGKDGIYIAWKIFSDYAENGELIAKKKICDCIDILLGNEKSLATNLGSMGVATLFKQKDRYVAHLLYAVPTKRGKDVEIIEDIYPVDGITLSIKVPEKIGNVYLAPQNENVSFKYENGYVTVSDIKLNCHQMIVFDKEQQVIKHKFL